MSQAIRRFDGIIPIKRLIIEASKIGSIVSQNTNAASAPEQGTLVKVSFHLASADWIPEETRNKLADIHKFRLSKEGHFIVRSDKTKTETLNLADCLDKIRAYIAEAEQPPPPEVVQVETFEVWRSKLEKAAAERLSIKLDTLK